MGVPRASWGFIWGCLALMYALPSVYSHVRFICPRPRSPRTDIFQQLPSHPLPGACGLGDPDFNPLVEDLTVVSPGPYTLQFEETHIHIDSPFHISLHSYGNESHSCSLLNHIPHNNLAVVDSKDCKDNGYPIGRCKKSRYYVTVNIPDIRCDQCYLKLTFITLDKVPISKLPCIEPNGTCRTYVSCANIRIQHSSAGEARSVNDCGIYSTNLLGDWPYTQQQIFQINLDRGDSANFTFDYYDMSLRYRIPTTTIGQVMSLSLYKGDDSKNSVLRKSVSVAENTGGLVEGRWKITDQIHIPQLISGQYKVEIVTLDGTYHDSLKYKRDMYQPNAYVPHRASYTKQGWLDGPEFLGSSAVYAKGIEPYGHCAPKPYYYFAAMNPASDDLPTNGTGDGPHGIISATFIDDQVKISAVFHGLSERANSLTLHGPTLAGAKSLTVPLKVKEGVKVVDLTIVASDASLYVQSTRFLRKVTVDTESGKPELEGTLEQGMRAVIMGSSGFYGDAAFHFLKDGSLAYSILIAGGSPDRIKSVSLNGPAHIGSPVIITLTDYFIYNIKDNTSFAHAIIKEELSSRLLLHLWQGHLYIDVKLKDEDEDSRNISGQISAPGDWYCTSKYPTVCPHLNLYLNGEKPDLGDEDVPTSAEAVFYVDRANALQYSIQVKLSKPQEVVISASVMENQTSCMTINNFKSYSLPDGQHVHEVNGRLPQILPSLKKLLSEGKLRLVIKTSAYPHGNIVGDIPKLERPHCLMPIRLTVDWDVDKAPFKGLNTVVGDIVLFSYSNNDTVYQLDGRTKYHNCDFSDSKLIGQIHKNNDHGQAQIKMTVAGEYFFASKLNCNNSLSTTIIVTDHDNRPFTNCSKSVYEVWYDGKMTGRGGTGVVGAIVGGSILAVISLILIVFVDRRRKLQSKSTSGFQRF